MDTSIFNAIFWTAFISTMVGCILKLTSMCYKSKCSSVDICCIKIIRNVELEEKENEDIKPNPNLKQKSDNDLL